MADSDNESAASDKDSMHSQCLSGEESEHEELPMSPGETVVLKQTPANFPTPKPRSSKWKVLDSIGFHSTGYSPDEQSELLARKVEAQGRQLDRLTEMVQELYITQRVQKSEFVADRHTGRLGGQGRKSVDFSDQHDYQGEIMNHNDIPQTSKKTHDSRIQSSVSDTQLSQAFKGNPMAMIPSFNYDPADKFECERWLRIFNNVSSDQQWSPIMRQHVLEAKLGPRAKAIYFAGLGNNHAIDIQCRLEVFQRMFTRAPEGDECIQNLFSCIQGPLETVLMFQMRIALAATTVKTEIDGEEKTMDRLVLSQFKKGLLPPIRREVVKQEPVNLNQAVEMAIKVEKTLKQASTKASMATVEDSAMTVDNVNTSPKVKMYRVKDSSKIQTNNEKQYCLPTVRPRVIICAICKQHRHIANRCPNDRKAAARSSAMTSLNEQAPI